MMMLFILILYLMDFVLKIAMVDDVLSGSEAMETLIFERKRFYDEKISWKFV